MRAVESILDLIGKTPILRLGKLENGGAQIWAKLESLNPGFSVKDRVGLALIRRAEADGFLVPGGTVVEATAGNTGLALAMVGRHLGYRVILVVPERFSIEKQRLMRALGGEVVVTDADAGIPGAQDRARKIAESTPGAVYVNQFANRANPEVHETTTGPEIYQQMGGDIDAFVAGCGSGGTFTGVARSLKKEIPHLLAVAVEPKGSVLSGCEPGDYEVEGIGMRSVHPTMDLHLADEIISVPDSNAFAYVRRLAEECGVLAGSSGGASVWAAVQVAARLSPDKKVVTVIPDSSERYLSKEIYDRFLEDE
ncbi:MAG: PLP-dependent cysteine synthase family protein [Holophagae bacterium]|jgi:cysteine synthase A